MAKTDIKNYIDSDADITLITDEIMEDVIRKGADGITPDMEKDRAESLFWCQAEDAWFKHKSMLLLKSLHDAHKEAVDAGVYKFTLAASTYYDGIALRVLLQWNNIDEPDEIDIRDIETFEDMRKLRSDIKKFAS